MNPTAVEIAEKVCHKNRTTGDTRLWHWLAYSLSVFFFVSLFLHYQSDILNWIFTKVPLQETEKTIVLFGLMFSIPIFLVMFFPSGVRKFVETFAFSAVFLFFLTLFTANVAFVMYFLHPDPYFFESYLQLDTLTNTINQFIQFPYILWDIIFLLLQTIVFIQLIKGVESKYYEETKVKYWIFLELSYVCLFWISSSPLLQIQGFPIPAFGLLLLAYKVYQYKKIREYEYTSGISTGIIYIDLVSICYISGRIIL